MRLKKIFIHWKLIATCDNLKLTSVNVFKMHSNYYAVR